MTDPSPTRKLKPKVSRARCSWDFATPCKTPRDHLFNKAREWGYTDAPNPCQGVKGFTEAGRDRYVTDAEFQAVHAKADATLRDAMDLALLTGQRPADVLKMKREHIRDGALFVVQNKTGVKCAIEIVGDRSTKEPDAPTTDVIKNGLRERGVLVGTTGTSGSMLKVRPTLAFTAREVPLFATALRATLESLGT